MIQADYQQPMKIGTLHPVPTALERCQSACWRGPHSWLVVGAMLLFLPGCQQAFDVPERSQMQSESIPAMTRTQVQELVESSEKPVIVEFGVDTGCARCDDMRWQVAMLSDELEATAHVVRLDFNANRDLAARYGANICPSYVIFQSGEYVSTRSYPTSAEMIRRDLESRIPPDAGAY